NTTTASLSHTAALGNLVITNDTARLTIEPMTLYVAPPMASKAYGAADPTLMGRVTGFLAADNVTATYSRAAGETVAGGPDTISAELRRPRSPSNYAATSHTALSAIATETPSLTPNAASKSY